MKRQMKPVCHCSSYKFPHRMSGGACIAASGDVLCGSCGQPTSECFVDYGMGQTEYWGSVSYHSDVQRVSACCEADLRDNLAMCLV